MKKYLSSGVELDVSRNKTGGVDITVICPPKAFISSRESLKNIYDTVYGALVELKGSGVFSKSFSGGHSEINRLNSGKSAGSQNPPKKQTAKVVHKSPAGKNANVLEDEFINQTSVFSPHYNIGTGSYDPSFVIGGPPSLPIDDDDHEAPILPPIIRVAEFALRHPHIAPLIGKYVHHATNISTNAQRFAENSGFTNRKYEEGEGSHWNAIRHAVWQATITSKFGAAIAEEAGNAHEDNPNADLSKRVFTGSKALDKADETIDLLNNILGREIGAKNAKKGMKEVALEVLKYYHEQGLYMAQKISDNKYTIATVKLTDEEYNRALNIYNTLNENGFTSEQQKELDKEIEKQNIKVEQAKRLNNQINPPNIMP